VVRIRLMRMGAHKRPFYRIVVADSRTRRDGPYIELLGTYDPLKDSEVKIDKEKVKAWIQKGAQPTDSVKRLLTKVGL
jgi:small subunit ribosomal protein S16